MGENSFEKAVENISGLTNKEINSIELNHTSKNEYSWSVKIYCEPSKEENTIDYIKKLDDKLIKLFKS